MRTSADFLTQAFIFHVLSALEKSGVLRELKGRTNGVSAKTLAQKLALDEYLLETLCNFLIVTAPEILIKSDGLFFLTSSFLETSWQNAAYFSLAYEPVLEDLHLLLTGKKRYGEDVVRNGLHLRYSSALYNDAAWNLIIERLKVMGVTTVVDCGCSAGDFLFRVCKNSPGIRGIGIDNDENVVGLAQNRLKKKENTCGMTFKVGDVSEPESWKHAIQFHGMDLSRMAFTGITVWHEFLNTGDELFLDIASRYRSAFPGALFIVVEYNGFAWDDLPMVSNPLRDVAAAYQLVHPLTKQGMPRPREEWIKIFGKAGIKITQDIAVRPNSTVYFGVL